MIRLLAMLAMTISNATALNCQLGADLALNQTHRRCFVTGHSETNGKNRTYYATCAGTKDEKQLEYAEGANYAQLVDPASREEIAKCPIDRKQFKPLIDDYRARATELENPKCYLTQWKGQMMFVANGMKGRCSFNMNKNKSQEFHAKTGVTPLYQCENDYFLSVSNQSAAEVYKKSHAGGWELACKAALKTGEPVENIDWKNPPQYWSPEADALGPSASPALDSILVSSAKPKP